MTFADDTELMPPERGFPQSEYEQRLSKVQQLMQAQALDVLLLSNEPEVRYFSGFLTQFWQSPTRPWFLLIPVAGKPVAVIPEIGAALMRSTWLDDIRCWPSPQPQDEGISLLHQALLELAGHNAHIGLMQGDESVVRMPLRDLLYLRQLMPEVKWQDCTPLVRQLRMLKSTAEVVKIRHICQVASQAFAKAEQLFYQEQPLIEAFRQFKIALLQCGADEVPYLVGGAGQGGYQDVISPPNTERLQAGDVLMLDTGSVFDGYFCDFDRNFAFGQAGDLSRRAYDTLYEATEQGMMAARPGATCSEVFTAMYQVINKAGYPGGGVGRMGHGLGMQLTEWPSHRLADHTVIEAGMVLTLEPGLSMGEGRIMVHEENIVVGEQGNEWLSMRAAADLPVIG